MLVLVILIGGFYGVTSYQQAQAQKAAQAAQVAAHAAAQAQQLKVAKAAASSALTDVEACESAVTVGVTLDDLSSKASDARDAALAFSRSDNGKLLPDVSSAIALAAQDYVDSCALWFSDNKSAQAKWQKAFDKWDPSSGKPAPDLQKFKDDSGYQAIWAKATTDLAAARTALQNTTQ